MPQAIFEGFDVFQTLFIALDFFPQSLRSHFKNLKLFPKTLGCCPLFQVPQAIFQNFITFSEFQNFCSLFPNVFQVSTVIFQRSWNAFKSLRPIYSFRQFFQVFVYLFSNLFKSGRLSYHFQILSSFIDLVVHSQIFRHTSWLSKFFLIPLALIPTLATLSLRTSTLFVSNISCLDNYFFSHYFSLSCFPHTVLAFSHSYLHCLSLSYFFAIYDCLVDLFSG
jgi:hypothetical protein